MAWPRTISAPRSPVRKPEVEPHATAKKIEHAQRTRAALAKARAEADLKERVAEARAASVAGKERAARARALAAEHKESLEAAVKKEVASWLSEKPKWRVVEEEE